MPDFGNSFADLKKDRKLTDAELIRAIMNLIADSAKEVEEEIEKMKN